MGALPRPDVPPGAQRDLNDALHELHRRAGRPSLRTLAREAGCSHTTVSSVFSSPRLPAWGILELLVEAMGGDARELHALWIEAADDGAPAAAASEPRIAGRRQELSVVRRHLRSGSGLLVVIGEAGIGKTHLTGSARRLEADSVTVATGSCLPLSAEVPLLPVADVLHAVLAVDGGQWMGAALAGCPPYVAGSLRHLLPELDVPDAGPDPQDDWARQRLFSAVEAALVALAAASPLALLLEDLHWADGATLDLLEHVAARGVGVPVVGTWRSADPDTGPAALDWLARVRRLPGVAVLELAPLSQEETAEQLAQLLAHPVDPDVVERVHARTRGHPLFTEHLAADTSDAGHLPGALADLLDRRLQGLPAEAEAVARVLGVADRPLEVAVAAEAAGLSLPEVTLGLKALAGRRLLADTSGDEVQLGHPLLAEASRRALVASERVGLHRRLAEVLGAGASPSAAEVAAHWHAAGDRTAELDWRIRAARAAEERFAFATAADQWLRVLDLWPPGAAAAGTPAISRWTACLGASNALDYSGQTPRSVELVEDALSWADDLPAHEAGEVYARAGGYRIYFDNPAAGMPLVDRAIELFADLPPSPGQLRAFSERASALGEMGRWDEASAALSAALEVSAALDDPVQHRSISVDKAIDDYLHGDRSAVERLAQLSAMTLPRPDPVGDIRAGHAHTALLEMDGASLEVVEEAARRGLESAAAWGIVDFTEMMLRLDVAEAAWRAGRVEHAAAYVDPVTPDQPTDDRAPLQLAKALIDVLRGRPSAADRLDALDDVVPTMRVWWVADVARVRLWSGHPEAALDLLVADVERRVAARHPQPGADIWMLLGRAAADVAARTPRDARSGRRHELQVTLDRLESTASVLPVNLDATMDVATPPNTATYAAERARLADRQTVDIWVAAAREWDRIDRPHDAAYARWRAAQVAIASSQASVADRLLRRAAQQAREHVPLLELIAAARRA